MGESPTPNLQPTNKLNGGKAMKRKIHDYTKPAEAESLLYSAQRLIANDCINDAEKRIIEAREILQMYLSEDNEIEEDTEC